MTSRVLRGVLAVVLTTSILRQVECRTVHPSPLQTLVQEVGKIGKKTVDLLCRPIVILNARQTPKNVVAGAAKKTKSNTVSNGFKRKSPVKTRFSEKRTDISAKKPARRRPIDIRPLI